MLHRLPLDEESDEFDILSNVGLTELDGVCRLSAICQQNVRERPRIGGYGKLHTVTTDPEYRL